jgi:hypothetical protein
VGGLAGLGGGRTASLGRMDFPSSIIVIMHACSLLVGLKMTQPDDLLPFKRCFCGGYGGL